VTVLDLAKAAGLLLFAALLQVTLVTPVDVASGHADLVLVLLVAIALLRGPLLGAVSGFWAGLILDVAALQALGLSSLLLTLTGYWAGRFGEATSRRSPHPPLVAVALATVVVIVGAAILHFMLGDIVPASHVLGPVLLPSLALNLLLAYPLYRVCGRLFQPPVSARREATNLV
jgi:rod shape-determining protein MreD